MPRVLAQEWANQASAIAAASAAGDSCHALQLASSLRTEVIAAEGKVSSRLRSPLLSGVNSLADRITCKETVTVQAPTTQPKPHAKPPPKHDQHDHHGHGGDDNKDHG